MAAIPPVQFDHRGVNVRTHRDLSPVPRVRVQVYPPAGFPKPTPFTFDGLLDTGASGLVLPESVAFHFNLYPARLPASALWRLNTPRGPVTMTRWPADVAIYGRRLPAGFEVFFNPYDNEVLVGREALFALLSVVGFEQGSWLLKLLHPSGSSSATTTTLPIPRPTTSSSTADIFYLAGRIGIGDHEVDIEE